MRINPLVKTQDLPNLPRDLQAGFKVAIVPRLGIDPYNCGIPSHALERELIGWRALEIEETGECYRLVYRINDYPEDKSVDIASFDIHNPAYDKAKERVLRQRVKSLK